MTQEEQLDLIRRHDALNGAGHYDVAAVLVTDDFFLTIPSYMPFGGTYRGKTAFRTVIPIVRDAVAVSKIRKVATTLGPDCAVEVVEFTFEDEGSTTEVAELIRFRGNQICEIRPYYSDPSRFIAAATKRSST